MKRRCVLAGFVLACSLMQADLAITAEEGTLAAAVGPRGPVGPEAPLTEVEKEQFAQRIVVEGRTSEAVQAACELAVKKDIQAVLLPAGAYVFDSEVSMPGGLVLLGEGSRTLVQTKNRNTRLFRVDGDHVRFTRLKLQGADTTLSTDNNTYGISVYGKKDVRIDHCELLGFSYATAFGSEASAQIDHCYIHHNLRDGLGYGVAIYSGAYVLVTDSEFTQNRHSLASNGALDWSSPKRVGKYLHKPGVRKTHWEFIHNRVDSNDLSRYELMAVDTHPGMDGTFVIEGNVFENLRHGVGIRDGSGLIRGNLFRNLRGKPFRPFIAISIAHGAHNGIPVENAMPHNIQVAENTFLSVGGQTFADGVRASGAAAPGRAAKYVIGRAENITIEGKLLAETRKDRKPPPIPWLQEMGEEGILHIREARPKMSEKGSVVGTVMRESGRPVSGAAVLIGERSAATDADGGFVFSGVSEAARFLVVRKPGFELALSGLRVRPHQRSRVNVRLLPDQTPPTFTSVRISDLTHASATLVWETSEPTRGEIEYGPGAGWQGDHGRMREGDKPKTSHRVDLTNLRPRTTYRLRVKAADISGNAATSEELLFGTAPIADPAPPASWGYYLGAGKGLWGRTSQEAHTGKFSAFLKGVSHENGALNIALVVGESNGYTGANAYPAEAGATYHYSFWTKGSFKEVRLVLMTWNSNAAEKNARAIAPLSTFTPLEKWTQRQGQLTMPTQAKRFVLMFQIYLEGLAWQKLGVLYVDDVEVSKGKTQVVRNGGAENE